MRSEHEARTALENEMAGSVRTSSSARFSAEFAKLNSVDYLNHDQRPTFVLDLEAYKIERDPFSPLAFCNFALLNSSGLMDVVSRTFSPRETQRQHEDERAFATWIIHQSASMRLKKSRVFFDTLWTVASISDGWAIISGVELSETEFGSSIQHSDTNSSQDVVMANGPSRNSSSSVENDFRGNNPRKRPRAPLGEVWPPSGLGTSDHITWIREFDWASTSLGPIETWPSQLRQACEMMLASPDPVTIFWGPDLILIYNEAYVALAGNKHPEMMGGSARVHWKEVWDQYDGLFDQIRVDGKALKQDNSQLFILRSGYLEEGFFNLVVLPLLGDDGSVVGFYEPVSEVTKQTLSERRMHTLLKVSECTSTATSLKDLWQLLLEALSEHLDCLQFAGLYSLQPSSSPTLSPQYSIEGTVGFKGETSSFRPTVGIYDPLQDGILPALRKAHESRTAVLLKTSDGSLSPSIIRRLEAAGIDETPRECVVYPLSSSVDDSIDAFLIIGVSQRRPYDEDYQLFVNLLARQVESTITFVKLFEKERERLKQQALYESELKFRRFAENAQVGIFSFDPAGNITFCNESWLEMSGHDRNDLSAMSWTHDVHPDNATEIKEYWDKIVNLEGPQTFEVQYKKPWIPRNRNDDSISLDRTWVIASAYAEVSADGKLAGILGCVTDISSWKWVDKIQSQRLSEALELKRQQENFLDITSHEMRNPLNAILHCAAELIELLTGLAANVPTEDRATALSDCLDASRTIVYCGRHQKRIIDDVLTLSKLDSNLLSISPRETRPLDVVDEVLKVFDTELRASSIQTRTELSDSYKALMIESVLADPHRLIQILINLVANAIKFTKGESLRSLHIMISAYTEEPVSSSLDTGVRYVPSGRHPTDPTGGSDWGTGDIVFLHFSVQDTGPGMSREEADLLFNRFAQGSPRTHAQYGGSGLGLWISRELAELHGGRIGISSELGLGSTFDFYVKGRRSAKPDIQNNSAATGKADIPSQLAPSRRLPSGPPLVSSTRSSPSVLQKPCTPPNIHVLIVEDNLINQKILAKLMRKQGYAVSIANHGEDALAIIHASTWNTRLSSSPQMQIPSKLDVVLADIEMPVMDGKAFVRQVRRLQGEGILAQNIPVIAVTGNARNEQIQQAKECGFDDVVSKPYRVEDLVAGIKKHVAAAVAGAAADGDGEDIRMHGLRHEVSQG